MNYNPNTLRLIAGLALVANTSLAELYTIAGFTFDDGNSVTSAAVVEGHPHLKTHTAPLFAGKNGPEKIASQGPYDPFIYFQRDKTIGRLLGGGRTHRTPVNQSRAVSLPDRNDGPPWPNVDRSTIELTWKGKGLRNKPGADFLVYGVGQSEGFSVSVRPAGTDASTPARYQFASVFDSKHNVNVTQFDLSSFGLAEGELITAIRIHNIFNSQASAGADKVDHHSGEGRVVYPGESGHSSAHLLSARVLGSALDRGFEPAKKADEGGGREFDTNSLDADIVFVVGLHHIEHLPPTPALAGQ